MNISDILAQHYAATGMSQAELSRRSGVPETTLSRLKTAESCTLDTWRQLARVIGPSANIVFVLPEETQGVADGPQTAA